MPADFRVSITNAPGRQLIPSPSFTWLFVPDKIPDPTKEEVRSRGFLHWMLKDGQN